MSQLEFSKKVLSAFANHFYFRMFFELLLKVETQQSFLDFRTTSPIHKDEEQHIFSIFSKLNGCLEPDSQSGEVADGGAHIRQ